MAAGNGLGGGTEIKYESRQPPKTYEPPEMPDRSYADGFSKILGLK